MKPHGGTAVGDVVGCLVGLVVGVLVSVVGMIETDGLWEGTYSKN